MLGIKRSCRVLTSPGGKELTLRVCRCIKNKFCFPANTAKSHGGFMIKIDFEKMGGLIPAIIQDHETNEILMCAFLDEKALNLTLETGKTWFFSRRRNKYWMKGEQSGNTQDVLEVYTDCDADTVVIKVKQNGGAACHTGNRTCFYVKWEDNQWVEHSEPLFDPDEVYKK
ncbi:phosphoribosyl-AMP cyclohydrolase [Syntrophotalea acetylenivorans]|nr:phosphoribosyl-AMP cyclohydrolase [Syntrophotalea acetylenivorans]